MAVLPVSSSPLPFNPMRLQTRFPSRDIKIELAHTTLGEAGLLVANGSTSDVFSTFGTDRTVVFDQIVTVTSSATPGVY